MKDALLLLPSKVRLKLNLSFELVFILFFCLLLSPISRAEPALTFGKTPEYVTIDGDLEEWKEPPLFSLGPQNQVAGSSKTSQTADFSAQFWLKMTANGLWLAAKITDDTILLPETETQILASDHIEFWLSFP